MGNLGDSTSPEATSSSCCMVVVGCPRCLMYIMLSKEDPKCPKCQTTVFLHVLQPPRCQELKTQMLCYFIAITSSSTTIYCHYISYALCFRSCYPFTNKYRQAPRSIVFLFTDPLIKYLHAFGRAIQHHFLLQLRLSFLNSQLLRCKVCPYNVHQYHLPNATQQI